MSCFGYDGSGQGQFFARRVAVTMGLGAHKNTIYKF
jgi:hypothetical protein